MGIHWPDERDKEGGATKSAKKTKGMGRTGGRGAWEHAPSLKMATRQDATLPHFFLGFRG